MQALMLWGCEEVQKLFLSFPWQKNKMEHSQEQQYVIKFCFHLGKTASERHALVKEAYIRHALSKARVFWSFSELNNWQKTIADMKQSGHPSWRGLDENVAKVNFWDSQPSFECQINHRRCQYVWNRFAKLFLETWTCKSLRDIGAKVSSDERKSNRLWHSLWKTLQQLNFKILCFVGIEWAALCQLPGRLLLPYKFFLPDPASLLYGQTLYMHWLLWRTPAPLTEHQGVPRHLTCQGMRPRTAPSKCTHFIDHVYMHSMKDISTLNTPPWDTPPLYKPRNEINSSQ